MKFLKEHILFILILSVCAVLRFIPLFDYDYTYDELSGLERTRFSGFAELIEKGVKPDAHPALIQLVLFYLAQFFGYTEWILKLPFLLCGFGAVVFAYFFGLRNFTKQSGLFAAVIFAFSLIFVYYAPIARMYIAGVFFSLGLLYYFFEIHFRKVRSKSNYVFFALFAILSAFNHHVNALFAFSLCLAGLIICDKGERLRYLLFCSITVVIYLPHVAITLHQIGHAGIGPEQGGWLDKPAPDALYRFIVALFGTGYCYILILLIWALFYFTSENKRISRSQLLLLLLFIINYLIVYLYSLWRAPIYQNSVMLFSGCCLVLFVSSFLNTTRRWLFTGAFGILTFFLLYMTYIRKNYYAECVHTVYDYQFKRTKELSHQYGEEAVYPCYFEADLNMKWLYFKKYGLDFHCSTTEDPMMGYVNKKYPGEPSSMSRFNSFISGLTSDYLVLASAMPLHQALAAAYFPYLIENVQTQAIDFKVYSRKKEDAKNSVYGEMITLNSTSKSPGPFKYKRAPFSEIVPEEFPFEAKASYKEAISREGQVLLAKTKIKLQDPFISGIEVCISVNDKATNEGLAYASKSISDFLVHPDSTVTIYTDMFMGTGHHQWKRNSVVTCYIWDRNKEKFRLLDFNIQVIDYWQKKWHYWE